MIFEFWEADKRFKFWGWCESLGFILVSKDAKVSSTTYSVPFTLAVLSFHLCVSDFFRATDWVFPEFHHAIFTFFPLYLQGQQTQY